MFRLSLCVSTEFVCFSCFDRVCMFRLNLYVSTEFVCFDCVD